MRRTAASSLRSRCKRTPVVVAVALLAAACGRQEEPAAAQGVVDQLKRDPLIHMSITGATPSRVTAQGGSSTRGSTEFAHVARIWTFDELPTIASFEEVLNAAIAAGVKVRSISCGNPVIGSLVGRKSVGGFTIIVGLEVRGGVHQDMTVQLDSNGRELQPETQVGVDVTGSCPDALVRTAEGSVGVTSGGR
jgi:hypothetical protein